MAADLKNYNIAIHGWQDESELNFVDFIKPYLELGVNQVLCTQVERDGTLKGIDHGFYSLILKEFPDLYLIASGGVAGISDLKNLDQVGIPAVVVGKALFEGIITLEEITSYVN